MVNRLCKREVNTQKEIKTISTVILFLNALNVDLEGHREQFFAGNNGA